MERTAIVFPGAAPSSSDVQLITLLRRCAARELDALRELWEATAPQMLAWLVQLLGEPDEAEGALPQCYRLVWRNALGYHSGLCPPRIWLRGLARSVAIEQLRNRDRATTPEDLQATLVLVDSMASAPVAGIADNATLRLLCLAYLSGGGYRVLGAALGMDAGSVRRRIRQGLVQMLGEAAPGDARLCREQVLAASWVLGPQTGPVRQRHARRLQRDPEARRLRMAWEARLAALAADPPPVRPDPKLWEGIAREFQGRPARERRVSSQRWLWFALLLALGAAAAFLLL